MKRILISLLTLLAFGIGSSAQTFSVAGDVEALSSGETVSFKLHIADAVAMTSTHFEIVLPAGFSVTAVTKNASVWDCMMSREGGVVGAISSSDGAFNGEGDVFSVEVNVPEGTAIGAYPVTINNIRVNGVTLSTTVEFNINVVNTHTIVLDETSTVMPTENAGVNVVVKRTIKANEWSTICLPFAMTEAQVKAAFGDDVELGDFKGYEVTKDDGGDIVGINVKFDDVTAIEANHPYIIKVSTSVSEFTVDGVDVEPEEEPMVNLGTNRKPKAIVGTYVAETEVPELCLFLSDNKFWYSTGATKMKAYRAYFDFNDVLTDVENVYGAPVFISFGDETTRLDQLNIDGEDSNYYDLNGRVVKTPQKGVYIRNGKKVIVK